MKGIILAGGFGTRLQPLTKIVNKCLLPLAGRPIIDHILDTLLFSGVDDIMLVSSPENIGQVISYIGSGKDRGCTMTYRVQDEANGIAFALGMCRWFVGDEKCVVILGDNIFSDQREIAGYVRSFFIGHDEFVLFAKNVSNPQMFGVPVFDDNGKAIDIVEKPIKPPCNKAIVGLYCYDSTVFDVIKSLKLSKRAEYEISDVNAYMVKHKNGKIVDIKSEWIDTGTHVSYRAANELLWSKR